MSFAVTIHGIPAPQGSKSAYVRKNGTAGVKESSKKVEPWREAIRAEVQRVLETQAMEPILDGPVSVTLVFRLPRPKSHMGKRGLLPSAPAYPAVRPDLDKLTRSSLDGLVMGGAIHDDSQIVALQADKCFADATNPPGLTVLATRWPPSLHHTEGV